MLFANGDSFTYGDELGGSRNDPPTHWHNTFPKILSKKLGVKNTVNIASCGASNQKIFRTTCNFIERHHKKMDYCVIMWSSWGRLEVCEPFTLESDTSIFIRQAENMNSIIPDHRSGRFEFNAKSEERPKRKAAIQSWYDEVYTIQTAITHHLGYMRHIQFLCDAFGIKCIQGVIHPGNWQNLLYTIKQCNDTHDWDQYKQNVMKHLNSLRPECRMGLGHYKSVHEIACDRKGGILKGGHIDKQGHHDFASLIYNIIKGIV